MFLISQRDTISESVAPDVDFGFWKLIANGSVKVVHSNVTKLTETSVIFDDGSDLEADAIVLALESVYYRLSVEHILIEILVQGGFLFARSTGKHLGMQLSIKPLSYGG